MQWFATAPSNIALIKYMGKGAHNVPDNPSLSYTLNHLLTNVMLETHSGHMDYWEPLLTPGAKPFTLTSQAQSRFLSYFATLKTHFGYTGGFIVRSCNNFPHSSGIASSASSFAALTRCAAMALSELTDTALPSVETQAQWSRGGSGSSCRSFFSPWALWDGETVQDITLPYTTLLHQVVMVNHDVKAVLSSEAHRRVRTSPFYALRGQRARDNLRLLLSALKTEDWRSAYDLCWREFQDMHQLFATCEEPFSYITDATKRVLDMLVALWAREGDGPIVTMDAGPNVHLLYRPDQAEMAQVFRQTQLLGVYDVL